MYLYYRKQVQSVPSSRIFVSYACVGDEQGAFIGKQLLGDIRATRTEAVADHETISDEQFIPFLYRELPQCSYLVFVQTPVSLRSSRVQTTVNMGLTLVERQFLRGVLRVIAVSSPIAENQLQLSTLRTFDASMDYARARDQLFLELGLIALDANDSFSVQLPPSLTQASLLPARNVPAQPSGFISQLSSSPLPSQPSGPMNRPSAPIIQPYAPHSAPPFPAGFDRSAVEKRNPWFKTPVWGWQPLKTAQTTIAAQSKTSAQPQVPASSDDRPPPLNMTRKLIIHWGSLLVLLLLAVLALILVIVLLLNLVKSRHQADGHLKNTVVSVPLLQTFIPMKSLVPIDLPDNDCFVK